MLHDVLQSAVGKAFSECVAGLAAFGSTTLNNTPVSYESVAFTKPVGAHWLRLTTRPGEARQKSMGKIGDRRFRTAGVALVEVYTPFGAGTGLSDDLAGKIQNHFSGVTIYGVVYSAVLVGPGRQEGSEWRVLLTMPFRADRLA